MSSFLHILSLTLLSGNVQAVTGKHTGSNAQSLRRLDVPQIERGAMTYSKDDGNEQSVRDQEEIGLIKIHSTNNPFYSIL